MWRDTWVSSESHALLVVWIMFWGISSEFPLTSHLALLDCRPVFGLSPGPPRCVCKRPIGSSIMYYEVMPLLFWLQETFCAYVVRRCPSLWEWGIRVLLPPSSIILLLWSFWYYSVHKRETIQHGTHLAPASVLLMLPISLYILKNVSYRSYRNMLIEQHEAETWKVTWKSEVLNKRILLFSQNIVYRRRYSCLLILNTTWIMEDIMQIFILNTYCFKLALYFCILFFNISLLAMLGLSCSSGVFVVACRLLSCGIQTVNCCM